jgi:hypothetical protein
MQRVAAVVLPGDSDDDWPEYNRAIYWTVNPSRVMMQRDIDTGFFGTLPLSLCKLKRRQYRAMETHLFPTRMRSLRSIVEVLVNLANRDWLAAVHDVGVLAQYPRAPVGPPRWEGSDAARDLREAIALGWNQLLKPKELKTTSANYVPYNLRVFRQHIYQEVRRLRRNIAYQNDSDSDDELIESDSDDDIDTDVDSDDDALVVPGDGGDNGQVHGGVAVGVGVGAGFANGAHDGYNGLEEDDDIFEFDDDDSDDNDSIDEDDTDEDEDNVVNADFVDDEDNEDDDLDNEDYDDDDSVSQGFDEDSEASEAMIESDSEDTFGSDDEDR